jgi:hypothetical protein
VFFFAGSFEAARADLHGFSHATTIQGVAVLRSLRYPGYSFVWSRGGGGGGGGAWWGGLYIGDGRPSDACCC